MTLGVRSIRSKLVWLTTAVSVVAIMLATAVTAWQSYSAQRKSLEQELSAVAAILAANLEASLIFQDSAATDEILGTLFANSVVRHARVVDPAGNAIAHRGDETDAGDWPERGFLIRGDDGLLSFPIVRDGRTLGTLQIRASLVTLDTAVHEILLISGAVMVAATLLAWLLAVLLGRRISRPIEHLVATMDRVSNDHDFSRRAVRTTDDETGTLIDGFNEMIETIETYHGELAHARDRAEAASQAKTQFLATMSHELRTPLNAIIGFSEVIRDRYFGERPETYSEYAGDIHNSAGFLLELINDLLDMSRLEGQAYRLQEDEVRAEALIGDCARMLQVGAEAKDIRIVLDLAAGETLLSVDTRGLRQVIVNLVGNAVKFTPRGGRVEVHGGVAAAGDYVLQVSDTGPGIPPQDLERVMEPFEQVRSHLSGEHGGTGLGLAISRAIVRLHGGDLRLASVLGEGTTAEVRLPASRVLRSTADHRSFAAGIRSI